MKSGFRWQLAAVMLGSLGLIRACTDSFEAPPPPPPDIGSICAYHADCQEHCVAELSNMAPYCAHGCSAAAPCPAGYACVSREQMGLVCVMGPCTADADCPEAYSCNTDRERCQHDVIPCSADADCPGAISCNQGVCVTFCDSDDDCKQGFYCPGGGRCLECRHNSHCAPGYACVGGRCSLGCIDSGDCAWGYECVGLACEPIQGGGSIEFGDWCDNDSSCVSFCHWDGYCTAICGGEDDTTTCPEGWECDANQLVCQQP